MEEEHGGNPKLHVTVNSSVDFNFKTESGNKRVVFKKDSSNGSLLKATLEVPLKIDTKSVPGCKIIRCDFIVAPDFSSTNTFPGDFTADEAINEYYEKVVCDSKVVYNRHARQQKSITELAMTSEVDFVPPPGSDEERVMKKLNKGYLAKLRDGFVSVEVTPNTHYHDLITVLDPLAPKFDYKELYKELLMYNYEVENQSFMSQVDRRGSEKEIIAIDRKPKKYEKIDGKYYSFKYVQKDYNVYIPLEFLVRDS